MIKILLTFYFLINMIVEIGMGMKFFSEYMCSVGKKYLDIDTDLLLGLLLLMTLFRMRKKSIAPRRTRQRSSILQHEIPHSRMLVRPYGHSQTPICPGIWGINSSRGNSIRYLLEILQKQRWRQQLASQLSTTEDTGGGKVNSHFIY